jgi:hypothetical protein
MSVEQTAAPKLHWFHHLTPGRLFLILLAVVGVLLLSKGWFGDRTKIDETTKRGDVIIRALEQFRADSGHYPKSLSELQPKYIKKIPQPIWGLESWQYKADESEFTLRVNESTDTGDGIHLWLRNRNNSGWKMGD